MDTIEILGLIAAIFTSIGFVPQLIKVFKTRSTKDISIGMYAALCIGFSLWIVYGVYHGAPSIILANTVSLSFAFFILYMKRRIEQKDVESHRA